MSEIASPRPHAVTFRSARRAVPRTVLETCALVSLSSCAGVAGDSFEQTYYLGVVDEGGRLPVTLYRVRVHGSAGALSDTKFASAWVPAAWLDRSPEPGSGAEAFVASENPNGDGSGNGRVVARIRQVLLGPEGLRAIPDDRRLVILAGADPACALERLRRRENEDRP